MNKDDEERPQLSTPRTDFDACIASIDACFDRLLASHGRLRASNAELIAAAKESLPFVIAKDYTAGRQIATRLQAAIAKAEEHEP